MRIVRAATLSFAIISAAAFFAPISATAQVAQDRVIGASMNSLYNHGKYQNVPVWLHRMANADGGKRIWAQGTFDVRSNNPPSWSQNWMPEVKSPNLPRGDEASWARVNSASLSDMVIVTDNFSGPPVYVRSPSTNPREGGSVPMPNATDWVTEITNSVIAPFEANTNISPTYWIYEGWADGGRILGDDGSSDASGFAAWRDRTTKGMGYGEWFDNLVIALQEDTPAAAERIKIIPVARSMVSVMENTAVSSLASDDWFHDNAPHGRDTIYLLAAMITYSALFEEQAPMPDFTGARINEVFLNNYDSIAAHIFEQR